MTEPPGRRARRDAPPARRVIARLSLAVLLVLGLAGCASATGTLSALDSDGFSSPSVSVDSDRTGTAVQVVSTHHATLPEDAAVTRAAEVVWRTTPVHVDRIQVQVGQSSGGYGRDRLRTTFGPRDPALDAHGVGDDVLATLVRVAVGVLVALAVVAVMVVLLVGRYRRRRAAAPAPRGPWAPPGPGPTAPR